MPEKVANDKNTATKILMIGDHCLLPTSHDPDGDGEDEVTVSHSHLIDEIVAHPYPSDRCDGERSLTVDTKGLGSEAHKTDPRDTNLDGRSETAARRLSHESCGNKTTMAHELDSLLGIPAPCLTPIENHL